MLEESPRIVVACRCRLLGFQRAVPARAPECGRLPRRSLVLGVPLALSVAVVDQWFNAGGLLAGVRKAIRQFTV